MTTLGLYVLLCLAFLFAFGLVVFLVMLIYAWWEKRRWDRMDIDGKLKACIKDTKTRKALGLDK